ncbi:hypothetical protein CHS0354_020007, partial [Potamilus streckersoni]
MIIPGYRLLQRFLEHSEDDTRIQTMRRDVIIDLNRRSAHSVSRNVCVLATVPDPTCKLQFFVNEEVDAVKNMLQWKHWVILNKEEKDLHKEIQLLQQEHQQLLLEKMQMLTLQFQIRSQYLL